MDYILFGFGTGATLALGGWLFRDLGPRIRDRAPAEGDVLSARELVSRMAWARFCSACGAALALAGIIIMLATIGAAIWNPPDDEGFLVVLIAYAVVTLLMLVWAGLFLRRFGAAGIIRPREAKPAPLKTETREDTSATGTAEASDDDTAAPASRTFDEVASARGGLGRFAAFFRRDTTSEEPDDIRDEEKVDDVEDDERFADDRTDDDEFFGEADDDADDKRLSVDDPLVVQVMGEIAEERVVEPDLEASLVSDLLLPGREDDDSVDDYESVDDDGEGGEPDESETVEDHEESTSEESALDLLRRKRLARLSGQQDDI